jgi:quinoprotein glucose dehydrogenase
MSSFYAAIFGRTSPAALLPLILLIARGPSAQGAGADWPEYLGGPERNHYSDLDQINSGNVSKLRTAWEFHTKEFGQMQCNPIIIGGVLFGATGTSEIFALNAATGRQIWRFTVPGKQDEVRANDRGVTYWTDGKSAQIMCTVGSYLYALDARTGVPVPGFGNAGRASLKSGIGPHAQSKWILSTSPGTIFGDLIVMPTRVSEDQDSAPGYIQAFNVKTGTLAWIFVTIPYPGEPGYDTWSKNSYANVNVGSANCWTGMAVDKKRGILYVPTGSAAPDFWGGDRVGNNLYANCLLALDATTGKLIWYQQTVHHDLWDRDLPSPPVLVTLNHAGRRVDAVAQTTKTGFVFVFDRVTGASLFPIEERPFPRSSLDGEQSSPTQPVPLLPQPYARQILTEADVSPLARNHTALLAQFKSSHHGMFQPFGKYPTIMVPGFDGGGEWGGPAVDPDGILYVNSTEMAWIASLSDAPKESDLAAMSLGKRRYTEYCLACHGLERKGLPTGGIPSLVDVKKRMTNEQVFNQITTGKKMMPGFTTLSKADKDAVVSYLFGEGGEAGTETSQAPSDAPPRIPYRFNGYQRWLDDRGYPAISPPWGTLSAIDLNTGNYLWRVPLGEYPELTAKGVPVTGMENYGGPVATAGNLLIIAATKDGMIRAFDKRLGKILWQARLPACAFATPSTYMVGDRQYLVVACGGAKLGTAPGDSYMAFALP